MTTALLNVPSVTAFNQKEEKLMNIMTVDVFCECVTVGLINNSVKYQ